MKIRRKKATCEQALSIKAPPHRRPRRPHILFTTLVHILSLPDLWATRFTFTKHRMEAAGKGPYLILMNHSSFLDLKIASRIFWPMPYGIVCTTDGFVGKGWLMRLLGCIPTQKFVTDLSLVMDMLHALHKNKTSVLMFPEAGYSFDGCATALPRRLGTLIKKLDVPVVTVITDGAFLRDPLYNGLQLRKTRVSAQVSCLFTKEEIARLPVDELDRRLDEVFQFDNFAEQYKNKVEIREKFRADGLDRILYRCPSCGTEGCTEGKGILLRCKHCGKEYELTTLGRMRALEGETEFPHIPDWFNWQRSCVAEEIRRGEYRMELDVTIGILADTKALYMVGKGRLLHNENGFTLTSCDGKLHYTQPSTACHTLNSDFYWYEIGDVIGIGNKERLYYCFPEQRNVVTKARLAAEELYKLKKPAK
ncbi:MAG: 1-acyl-sn-glycerol-3-phosphate acyltransferase [Oscillospiraceae bacterium]|nr:1-acyl-sn-glycerol-3-phosphate acyltransferase [Oscillospiraceae bacterium]